MYIDSLDVLVADPVVLEVDEYARLINSVRVSLKGVYGMSNIDTVYSWLSALAYVHTMHGRPRTARFEGSSKHMRGTVLKVAYYQNDWVTHLAKLLR